MEYYLHITLFVLLQLCFIVQLYFLIGRHGRLSAYKNEKETPAETLPISVIVSARNEARNLSELITGLMQQDYPDYEVILVNDCSSDGSDIMLLDLEKQYEKLKVVTVTENMRFRTGKKFALTLGIKAAQHEHLLFTDADCRPTSNRWISLMARNFTPGTEIVLGYAPYIRRRGLLNAIIRFETVKTAINYLSAALHHDAYMGIGRNLAYTKSLFFKSKGFASHMHLMSGDDDLFVNENATATNVKIETDRNAFMYSAAKTTFSSWYKQKKRHMGVGKIYRNKHRRFLSFDALSGFFFYVFLAISFIFIYEPWVALGLYVFRLGLQWILYFKIFKRLKAKDLLFYLPFLDLMYYLYLNIFGLIGTFVKTVQWK